MSPPSSVADSEMQSDQVIDETDYLVKVNDITVSFGTQTILKNVTLSIERGQTLAIIGESGCGKTVLMKTIVGLVTPCLLYTSPSPRDS